MRLKRAIYLSCQLEFTIGTVFLIVLVLDPKKNQVTLKRFIPTLTDYIKAIRLFIGSPIWTAIYRDTDEAAIANMKVRKNYLSRLKEVKSQKMYYRDTDEAQIEQLTSRQRYLQQYGKVEN